ncbi:MAG TPA: hypothetical protein VHZ09_15150 [Acidobacteriaceae bacterium]|jgi:hypothetical protein|nr:hypothetical protein [Acidobacteriaceae bacterium]
MTAVNLRKYGTGSKKRIEQIRWKRWEIIHALILFLLMTSFCVWIALWIATHKYD